MSSFWNDKQVIVSGACGMIGSRLSEFLRDAGANVFGIDNLSRGKYRVDGVTYWVRDVEHALGEYDTWMDLGNKKLPFAFFNLAAAVGGVYYNLKNHADQYWQNMRLQAIPALWAAQREMPIFLQTSSVCIYANGLNNPAQEFSLHMGTPEPANEGYAWAKRMGEHVCRWSFGDATKYVIVRPTNCYGIRDYFDERAHVIPALIKKFLTQDKATVYGGDQTREFIYADDVARGMMVVAEHGVCGEAYNLGTSGYTQVTIDELAETIYRLTDSKIDVTIDYNAETGDQGRSTDSRKAEALGWKYQVELEEGLERVIGWYRKEVQCL